MSRVRKFLKLMMPPIISKMREARLRNRHFLGPYATCEEALSQVKNDAFNGEVWERHTNAKLLAPKKIGEHVLPQHQVVLAALVSQLSVSGFSPDRPIKIVDWGGGGGTARRDYVGGFICGRTDVCRGRQRPIDRARKTGSTGHQVCRFH